MSKVLIYQRTCLTRARDVISNARKPHIGQLSCDFQGFQVIGTAMI